jgi:CDP-paratose 2-epimerase
MTGPVLITGGAGFIGCNLADRLALRGLRVILFDNLSRPEVSRNLEWLKARHGEQVQLHASDIRDPRAVREAVQRASHVYHLAAQVAVTTSLLDPHEDFAVNALGTLHVLDAVRAMSNPPPLVFTSTNKVYGSLEQLPMVTSDTRYVVTDPTLAAFGVSEEQGLQFHSPYGCSKGSADQYVLDHARCFGLPAVVFRMSCIYGPRQFGTEDQGWVAHFLRSALEDRPLTIYGDGKQVRDLLFVDDLVDALELAQADMATLRGQAFNLGGGPTQTLSLLELVAAIERATGRRPQVIGDQWRSGDQRWYVSDARRFAALTGWRPKVGMQEGLLRLMDWLRQLAPGASQREAQA